MRTRKEIEEDQPEVLGFKAYYQENLEYQRLQMELLLDLRDLLRDLLSHYTQEDK